MQSVSRRTFLQYTAAGLAAFAAGGIAGCAPAAKVEEVTLTPSAGAEPLPTGTLAGEWRTSVCSACHSPLCGTKVRVVDGVAVEIKGDPAAPTNEGRLCPRGLSVLGNTYNPYRVQAPMKRTNPEKAVDNDPGWVEITWDEAYETVGAQLRDAYEYNPNSILWHIGFGDEGSRRKLNVENAIGTSNRSNSSGPLCPDHLVPIAQSGFKTQSLDYSYCKLYLRFGMGDDDTVCANGNTRSTLNFADARVDGGMKIISVDPRKGNMKAGDEWVPILPGTDTALIWALVNVLLHENDTLDEEYLKTRTNACYLVPDNPETVAGVKGLYEDYARGEDGKALVWDEKAGAAVAFDASDGSTAALFGEYDVPGGKAKTVLQIVKDYVADMTPEWAADITTVPADTTRSIAKQLVDNAHIGETIEVEDAHRALPYRPVSIVFGSGADANPLNTELQKGIGILRDLIGAIDVPGAARSNSYDPGLEFEVDENGLLMPPSHERMKNQILGQEEFSFPPKDLELSCFYPMKHTNYCTTWNVVNDPQKYYIDYEPRVLMVCGGNPLRSNIDSQPVEDAMRAIPFMFEIALWYDEPTQFCDVLLAASGPLERSSFITLQNSSINLRRPEEERGDMAVICFNRAVIDPVYNTQDANEIYLELADRMGLTPKLNAMLTKSFVGKFDYSEEYQGLAPDYELDPNTRYTFDDLCERKIKTIFGEESGGWAKFDECGVVTKRYKTEKKSAYVYQHLLDNNIRTPIYYNRFAENIKLIEAGCEEHGVSFPGADMADVKKMYSAAPAFFDYPAMRTTDEFPLKPFKFKLPTLANDQTGLSSSQWIWDMQTAFDPKVYRIWVPASVCEEMGLKEEDDIVVESCFGAKIPGKVHVSQMIHPSTLGFPGKYGARGMFAAPYAQDGSNYNRLLNGDEKTINFPQANGSNTACCRIVKA